MSTTQPTRARAAERGPTTVSGAPRAVLMAAPVTAGLLTLLGHLTDPAAGLQGHAMARAYADQPGPMQIQVLAYHFSYALWTLAALMLVLQVRGRGRALGRMAAVLGVLGLSTMPGLVSSDFYDSAITKVAGTTMLDRTYGQIDQMWAFGLLAICGFAGLLLALPLAAAAAWRARLLPWWVGLVALLGGVVYTVTRAQTLGSIVLAVCLCVTSFAIWRADLGRAVSR